MPSLTLFNSEGRRRRPFEPLVPGRVTIYNCGPTVYNHPHIGNLRTFVAADLLRRTLGYLGYEVHQVMNITDVDDKIIAAAVEEGANLADYTAPFVDSFFEDLDTLHVERAELYPRATEHIGDMLAMIETLIDRGHAYEAEGSVFFRISSDEDYGRLSGKDLTQVRQGERVLSDEYDKEDVKDFVLWKAAKEGEPSWPSPWGPGRPGWHIECSAMSTRYLGETFDIHTGGVDLIFPHHENEIAQSESSTGRPSVRFWVHSEHLIVDGRKMSKSLGNQFTLSELLERGAEPRALRYLFLSVHYRQKLNFTFDSLEGATAALKRVDEMRFRLDNAEEAPEEDPRIGDLQEKFETSFRGALEDDLNISAALAEVFTFIKTVNKRIEEGPLGAGDGERIQKALARADRVLGVLDPEPWRSEGSVEGGDGEEIEDLVRRRDEARGERDFVTADRLRDDLTGRGIVLEDTPQGTRWKRS